MKRLALAAIMLIGCTEYQLRVGTAATDALITCDVAQTYYVSDNGRWDRHDAQGVHIVEKNPLLGETPSPTILAVTLFGAVALNTLVGTSRLPRWLRTTYLLAVGVAESAVIVHNASYANAGACGLR